MAIYRNSAAGGKWATTTSWEEETAPSVWIAAVKAPGIADTVNLVKAGGTVEVATGSTAEAKEVLANTAGNEFEKTLKLNTTGNLKVAGSIIFSAAMTWTVGTGKVEVTNTSGTAEVNFQGKEGQQFVQNGSGGTVKLASAMPLAGACIITAGTFDSNGQEISCTKFEGSSVAKLKLGASTIKCTTTGEAWSVVEGTTVEAGTSTIELTNTSETSKKFKGGSKTYYTLIIATDNAEIQGSNTFTNLRINTRGKSVKGTLYEKSSVQTITGEFTSNATEAEKVKMKSGLAGKTWKIKKTSGTVEITGVELQDSKGEGGATFRDVNGISVSGNEGWTFVHEHSLSATQSQSASKTASPSRVVSATQSQSAGKATSLARALTAAQAQSPTMARSLARALAAAQGQSPTVVRTPARTLSSTQGQGATLLIGLAKTRALTAGQGQTSSVALVVARSLSAGQVAQSTIQRALNRGLAVGQGQAATTSVLVARSLVVTGVTTATISSSTSRSLEAGQGQVVAYAIELSRYLATEQATIAAHVRAVSRALSATQGQGVGKSLALARGLSAGQGQSATASAALSTSLTAGQGQSVSFKRGLAHGLNLVAGQSAALSCTVARTTTVAQSTTTTVARALARTLSRGQGQSASLSAEVEAGETLQLLTATATSTPRLTRGISRTWTRTQVTTAVMRRGVGRTLLVGQAQSATINARTFIVRGGKATSSVEAQLESDTEAGTYVASSSATPDMLVQSTTEVRV